MTQEEKAKAYDEAIAKAQKELQTCGSTDCDSARQIYRFFPELKENGDEKIRGAIIHFISHTPTIPKGVIDKETMIAWLEKQADKDKLIKEFGKYKAKYTQEVLQNHLNSMANKDDERLRKTTIAFLKEFADKGYENAVECIDWLEKQNKKLQGKTALESDKEEKVDNANKVEPKFHEGDWVVDNECGKVNQITSVRNQGYDFANGDYMSYESAHRELRLWDISNAKDGDVLASELCDSIILFKGIKDDNIDFYCDYDFSKIDIPGDRFAVNNGQHYGNVEDSKDFHPATKEQRDALLKAMADAGYTFDFEKKELKKIEQKLSNSAKIGKNDTILDLLNKMPSCITVDGIDYHFVMKKTIAYMAFYEGEGEGSGKVIFWMAGEPIELLTAMLEKLKKEGLLELTL